MRKKFKLLERRDDCVLLYDKDTSYYKVVDIEGDIILVTPEKTNAYKLLENYSLEDIRKRKRQSFKSWCEEWVEE